MFLQPHLHAGHPPSVPSSACSNLCSFSPLSPCHVFINMRLFLLFFPPVFILDFILTYLLTFSFHLMVLLLNVRHHKRLNTSVYETCPQGFPGLLLYPAMKFCIFETSPSTWEPVKSSLLVPEGQDWSTKINETLGSNFLQLQLTSIAMPPVYLRTQSKPQVSKELIDLFFKRICQS